jgi:hypothetical protein
MISCSAHRHSFVLALFILGSLATTRPAAAAGASGADSVRYGSPIDLPLAMSATFGEYRQGHFHAGVDFSTGGREGVPVLAIDDGQVVRVRASAVGYGRAIYVHTRSGQLAVYGHLSSFMPELARYVESVQDSLGRYRVDLTPPAGRFPVKRGQVLGRSGSSGAGGPHFHFEMREGDIAINPLGEIRVPDVHPPQLFALFVTPLEVQARVNGGREKVRIPFSPKVGSGLVSTPPITIEGRVGLGVQGYDRAAAAADNHLGIYRLELWVDGERAFSSQYDRFDYLRNHEVEAQYDYEEVLHGRRSVANLFVPVGVVGDFYGGLPAGSGVLTGGPAPAAGQGAWPGERVLTAGEHALKIVATDAAGNQRSAVANLIVRELAPASTGTQPIPGSSPPAVEHASAGSDSIRLATPTDGQPRVKLTPDGRMAEVEVDFNPALLALGGCGSGLESLAILLPGATQFAPAGSGRFRARIDAQGGSLPIEGRRIFPEGSACEPGVRWDLHLPWIAARRTDTGTSFLADRKVRVELKPDAFFEDTYVFATPVTGSGPAWPKGLTPRSPVFELEPATLPLDQGFWLGLEPAPDPDGGTKAVSLYRFDGDDWSYVGSEHKSGDGRSWIGGDVKRLSRFALARDTGPPQVEWLSPASAITAISSAGTSPGAGARPLIRVRVRDDGAGFREDDLTFIIDGKAVPSEWDPDAGDLRYTPRKPLAPGRHVLIAEAKDRAGLVTRRERTLTVR